MPEIIERHVSRHEHCGSAESPLAQCGQGFVRIAESKTLDFGPYRHLRGELQELLGGIAGMFVGQWIGRRLSGPVLEKVFVVAIVAVAAFVIVRNLNA